MDTLPFTYLISPSFKLPSGAEPFAVPPPPAGSFAHAPPFDIPESWWVSVLDARVPVTIAVVYAITAKALTSYNLSRNKQPWAISKTRAFKVFVVLHNVFLAVYSAWTFVNMAGAMHRAIAGPNGPNGITATIDSFCQINGVPGFDGGVFFNEETGKYATLGNNAGIDPATGRPSRYATGRLWNEGLAFYGWWFYLSKFYEVLDTVIILAKGKPSSTLQTYHHAGAMMCMWAGIRWMAPPIWLFVVYNSLIHSLMYTYYTVTAFNIRVPMVIKRSLTTMQITQFLVGVVCAMSYAFVAYALPMTVQVAETVAAAEPQPTASMAEANDSVLSTLKQMVIGVMTKAADVAAAASSAAAVESSAAPTNYRTETVYVTQNCVNSSGVQFAVWLNVFYLAPLTYLFVSFFIASYTRRGRSDARKSGKVQAAEVQLIDVQRAEKAGWEAAKSVEKEVYGQDGASSPKRATRSTRSKAAK
ncbi:Elongation of very long chain fatty acids protein 3 [Ceratocystis lukuohia]|uniref:Elongation of fatty acids protein n=2 Tax=Ceratocystis TaxID=5157 RepID=A0A2C5WRN8_9PEZI|nr:Elongation of very long chain fatty acids protein 3 [Ceratocystis fimbriata CBS 114723]